MCVRKHFYLICVKSSLLSRKTLEEEKKYLCALFPLKHISRWHLKEIHYKGKLKAAWFFWKSQGDSQTERSGGILRGKCTTALKYCKNVLQRLQSRDISLYWWQKSQVSVIQRFRTEGECHRSPFIFRVQSYLAGIVQVPQAAELVWKEFQCPTVPLNVLNHWY